MPGANVTDAGLVYLQRLTHLNRLNLSKTRVNGSGMKHFERLNELRSLDLSDTQVTDAGLNGLVKLPPCSA